MHKFVSSRRVLLLIAAWLTSPQVFGEEPVRIGATTSLTGSLANFGAEQQRGIKMWVDDVNARGALLGRPVELVLHDDGSDVNRVGALYERLITEDRVDFLISPYSSRLTLAAIPVSERYGVPMVTVASAADIWKAGHKNVFGLYTPANSNMTPVLDLAKDQGLKTLALIYLDDEFPRDVAAGVRANASTRGLSILIDEQYSTDLAAMPALAKRLAAANPDVIVVGSYMDDAVAFAQAARAVALKPKVMAFSGAPALAEFGERLGIANVQGILSTVQWSRDVRVPGGFDLAFRYERLHGRYPSYDAAGAYAAGQVLEAAVRLAGTTERPAVREQLSQLKFRSTLGNYRVDAAGLQTAKSTYLVQWQDDHISLVYPPAVARWKLMYPYPG